MPLLDNAFEEFAVYDKTMTNDGYGGIVPTWTKGVSIQAAIVCDTSSENKIAQALGSTSNYTLTTRRNVMLMYHDVIQRVSDSKFFRVTSDGDDKFTPSEAGLDMRQVTCEEWSLNG